jgi:lichenan operon transcriptional antiterminator
VLSDRHERVLDYLSSTSRWVAASEIADRLGVTPRSVRNYVTAIRDRTAPSVTIESSGDGYRLDPASYAAYLRANRTRAAEPETPRDRLYNLVRRLGDASDSLDVYELAQSLFVSESTIESDLRRMRPLLQEAGLTLTRRGSAVRLTGSERDVRLLLSRMFREEHAQDFFELESVQREFAAHDLGSFKTELLALVAEHGYYVNEYGINDVLLHVAIAVDRVSHDDGAAADDGERAVTGQAARLSDDLGALLKRHFEVELSTANVDYLTLLLTTRVVTPGQNESLAAVLQNHVEPTNLDVVRAIVRRVQQEYLVDLEDDAFMVRFSLHLGNLVARAQGRSYAPNPLARSIKTSYPMTFELAVFIASEIQRRLGIPINDDEIGYIALHVGSHLERRARREDRLTCAIVCANYYDLHTLLRARIESALGDELQVENVITRTDVDPATLAVDLVISATGAPAGADNVVTVSPLPTADDLEAVRRGIARVRRHRRRDELKSELLTYFDESLFVRNLVARSEEEAIRALGARMVERGVIDQAYVEGAVERERMSSTAFTDDLAVPHALEMSAARTSIGIAINDSPLPWGGSRVHVVALIAFSESGRASFQRVFDQFVEVFSAPDDVRRILRNSPDFASFIEELVRVMDS